MLHSALVGRTQVLNKEIIFSCYKNYIVHFHLEFEVRQESSFPFSFMLDLAERQPASIKQPQFPQWAKGQNTEWPQLNKPRQACRRLQLLLWSQPEFWSFFQKCYAQLRCCILICIRIYCWNARKTATLKKKSGTQHPFANRILNQTKLNLLPCISNIQ